MKPVFSLSYLFFILNKHLVSCVLNYLQLQTCIKVLKFKICIFSFLTPLCLLDFVREHQMTVPTDYWFVWKYLADSLRNNEAHTKPIEKDIEKEIIL